MKIEEIGDRVRMRGNIEDETLSIFKITTISIWKVLEKV